MAENFYETIFLKRNSYQEEQFNKLTKKNTEQYKMLEKGLQGEKDIEYHLTKSNIGMYVLRDINLAFNGMTAQIDYIVITSKHCYFIECKNYSGNVKVDDLGNFTISKKQGRYFHSKGIYSPIRQVETQLDVFLKICLNNQDKTKELLNGIRFKNYFKTLVVFTNSESILKINKAPEDIKDRILKVDNLIRIIEQDQKKSTDKKLDRSEMEKIGNFFLEINRERKIKENNVNNKEKVSQETPKKKHSILKILGILFILLIIYDIYFYSGGYKNFPNYNNDLNLPNQKEKLTENQLKALDIMKSGYESSKTNGFEVIHTSVCNQISGIFSYKLDCNKLPMYVNFIDDNTLTIKKNFNCYTLKFDKINNIIESKSKEYVAYDTDYKCDGMPVGNFDWNPDNEYFQKIGGYEKIREMAIYAYNNNAFVSNYYDGSHMVERGANQTNYTKYSMRIDMFFSGLTGRGYELKSDTTREKTNEMCEALYYLGK